MESMWSPISAGLLTGMVVSYRRPFSTSDAGLRLSGKWERFDDPDLLALHKKLKELRDQLLAHNDETIYRDTVLVPFGDRLVVNELTRPLPVGAADVSELARFQHARITERFDELREALVDRVWHGLGDGVIAVSGLRRCPGLCALP